MSQVRYNRSVNQRAPEVEPIPFQRGKAPPERPRAPLQWISPELWRRFEAQGTDAHRVATSRTEWIERLGDDLLFSYRDRAAEQEIAEILRRVDEAGFSPRRLFGKYLPTHAAERLEPALLHGAQGLPMQTEVQEAGVIYGLDFAAGYSAGLFIDQRANRARLAALRPARVLNTFAYTCSFSVVAALAGAETLSLDLSRRSLARGEENFRRNGLDPALGHRFIADDVLEVLPRLARRGELFNAIVLDPPTFSRNQAGQPFQVQRDFGRLVELALGVAAPGAALLLSVNHSELTPSDLERTARYALKVAGRTGSFHAADPLPDFPPGTGAQTVWLALNAN